MKRKPINGGDGWGWVINPQPCPVFFEPKPTFSQRSTPMRSCPPQPTCLNRLPCLHLLPGNRPTKAFPASKFTPAKTHIHLSVNVYVLPALPFFFLTTVSPRAADIGRDASQTPRTPVVTREKSCPCVGHCLIASKVKRFVLGKHKHEIGIAVMGKWMNRYHRYSISSDVQKQMKALHSHR